MPQRSKQIRTIEDLTTKQKKFIDTLVSQWGQITKTDALIKAGESEFIVCDESQVSHLEPKYNDDDDSV